MLDGQRRGAPVHTWPLASAGWGEEDEQRPDLEPIGRFMTTDLFTVRADDLVDLAASVMEWRHIKNVPVEDAEGRLVGLVTHRDLLRLVGRPADNPAVAVREIMTKDPSTVTADTPALEAMRLMRACAVGCLPVVESGRLIGLVTESDLLRVAERLLASSHRR
jgi:CBS domain-containing protein